FQFTEPRLGENGANAPHWMEVDLFLEQRLHFLDRGQRALHHMDRRSIGAGMANKTGCTRGRAAGKLIAVENENVTDATFGQVIGDRAADYPAADDDNGNLVDCGRRRSAHGFSPVNLEPVWTVRGDVDERLAPCDEIRDQAASRRRTGHSVMAVTKSEQNAIIARKRTDDRQGVWQARPPPHPLRRAG